MLDGNNISQELRYKLAQYDWDNPQTPLDLHKLGVHFFCEEYLPTRLSPETYATYLRRGLTPPNALPIFIPSDTSTRIKQFLDMNYYKLSNAGVQYLGNEANYHKPEDWDKSDIKICFVRISDYETMDGAFGGQLIANFIRDFTDNIFCDFAYFPHPTDISKIMDADLPLMWGNISKKPLLDFDIIYIGTSYPGERVNLATSLVKSGIPLYRWERFDETLPYSKKLPLVCLAGIGGSFCLTSNTLITLSDNSSKPIKDIAIGDLVKSFNPNTLLIEDQPVTATYSKPTDVLVHLLIDKENGEPPFTLSCTPDHRLFFKNRGWIQAEFVQAGHVLYTDRLDGTYSRVLEVKKECLDSPVEVFDITVNDTRTFFIENSVISHNCENVLGDNPVKGTAQNANVDLCFTPETLVHMADGSFKQIKDIRPGMLVKSFNTSTSRVENKRVNGTKTHSTRTALLS